jgi:hypothetical protein
MEMGLLTIMWDGNAANALCHDIDQIAFALDFTMNKAVPRN